MKARALSLVQEGKEGAAETVREELLSEHPGRRIYRTNKRDFLIQELVAPPVNGDKKTPSPSLPVLRNRISAYLFEYLKGFHVPTHFLKALEGAEMLVKCTDPIPLVVRVYNVPEDDWQVRFGLEEASRMEFPVIEHYLPGSGNSATWVNEYHLYAFNLLKPEEFRQVNRLASKVNAVLRGLCDRRDLALAWAKLSFGRYNDQVILTGELSHLTCRFLEAPASHRGAGAAMKPVDSGTEEGLERLYGRLKLNG